MSNTLRISLDCDRERFDRMIDQLLEEGLEDKIRDCGVECFDRYGTTDVEIRSRNPRFGPAKPNPVVSSSAPQADDLSPPAN